MIIYIPDDCQTMSLSGDDYDLLERKFAMYVLVAVSENPHSTKTQIMRLEEGNERTKYQRLRELSDAGYIEYVRSDNYAGERMVLSRDAEEIVSYLNKIRSVMARRKPQNDNKDVPERRGGSAVQAEDRKKPVDAVHLHGPSL